MADYKVPNSQTRERRILVRARAAMGVGRGTFAARLNEIIYRDGPMQYPVPVDWRAIEVWETVMRPPKYVVDAVVELLRVTNTEISWFGLDWVDTDALVPA
ncbi:hypothetical protein [Nocardia sp. NPDC005366]|uniref:hypothetical protein n=1 Tax=Nocardia sp. NPDC005366 TaxID=3156878 RepID=UPI0033A36BC2